MKIIFLLFLLALPLFAQRNPNIELGSVSTILPSDLVIIERSQYVVAFRTFNNSTFYLAFNLNSDWLGNGEKYAGNFITDTSYEAKSYPQPSDYENSGYELGQMVNSEERTDTFEDNKSTYLMTNVLPLRPELYHYPWKSLVDYCKKLCIEENKELYIYTGPIYYNQYSNLINGIIPIPGACFKIIVVMERGQGHKDVTENTKVISVIMPNTADAKNHDWQEYITTPFEITKLTSLSFFDGYKYSIREKLNMGVYSSVESAKTVSFSIKPTVTNDYIEVAGISEFNVIDILGNVVLKSTTPIVSVSNLSSGMYFVQYDTSIVPFFVLK